MTTTAAQITANVRRLSSLFNNNLFSDPQIVQLFNDGASELYDFMVGQFETWFLTSVDFTLAGGVGANVFAMPMDKLLKDNTLELNPGDNTPIPIPRLGTWSDRNRIGMAVGGCSLDGGRRYYPAGSNLMVFPPNNSAGAYRLWYTPKYIPVATPATIDAETASISVPTAASNVSFSSSAFLDATTAPWLSTDAGNTVAVLGAVNPGNNGTHAIAAYDSAARITLVGSYTPETLPPTATVTLLRNSRVDASGHWTFYGDNPFNNVTIAVKAGDVMTVKGTPSNDGSYAVTQDATGGNTIVTGGTTLAENFPGAIVVTVQPVGTVAAFNVAMEPWVLYPEIHAAIAIRTSRQQDTSDLQPKLAQLKQRISTATANRTEEVSQSPLRDGQRWGNNYLGGG